MSNRIVSMNSVINRTKTNLDNTYTSGSGVGGVSIANRRALLRRAALKPGTMENPKTGKCNGFCVNGSLPHPSGVLTHNYNAGPQHPVTQRFYLYGIFLQTIGINGAIMSFDDSVNNSSLSEITNNITNIYNNFSFDNINSFSNDDANTLVSIANAPTQEIQNSIEQTSGILNKSFINSLTNNYNTYYNVLDEINNNFFNIFNYQYNIINNQFNNQFNNQSINLNIDQETSVIKFSTTTTISSNILLDLTNKLTKEIITSIFSANSKYIENFDPKLSFYDNFYSYLSGPLDGDNYNVAIINIFNLNFEKNLDKKTNISVLYWINPYNNKINSTLANINNRKELFDAISIASRINYNLTLDQRVIKFYKPWHPIYGFPSQWIINTIEDMSYMFASLPDIRIIYQYFLDSGQYWINTTRKIENLSIIIEPDINKLNNLFNELKNIVINESQRTFNNFNINNFLIVSNDAGPDRPGDLAAHLNYNNNFVLNRSYFYSDNNSSIISFIIIESSILKKHNTILKKYNIIATTPTSLKVNIKTLHYEETQWPYPIGVALSSPERLDFYIPEKLNNLYNITEYGNILPFAEENFLKNFLNPFNSYIPTELIDIIINNDIIKYSVELFPELNRFTSRHVNLDIINSINLDTKNITDMSYMFLNLSTKQNLEILQNFDVLSSWKVDNVTNMSYMFSGCNNFTSELGSWKVDNVTDMNGMFARCYNFTSELSSWKVHNVTNMSYMFVLCRNFTGGDLSNWKVHNVTNMNSMFDLCENFTSELGSWKVHNVTDMSYMFYNCKNFNSDLSNWKVHNVTNMKGMFYNCVNFRGDDLSNWKVKNVTDMSYMFYDCENFTSELGRWNVEKVTNMNAMFSGCKNFDSDLSIWQVQNVTDMNSMFYNCTKFTSILKDWNVKKVTNMGTMFYGCTNFYSDLSSWKVENVTDMERMFYNCANFVSYLKDWKVDNVVTINGGVSGFNEMFFGCNLLLDTYPNLPISPIGQDWISSNSNYWLVEPS